MTHHLYLSLFLLLAFSSTLSKPIIDYNNWMNFATNSFFENLKNITLSDLRI